MNTHLSGQFDNELDAIRAQLTQMGGLVEQQLSSALMVIGARDPERIERVIAGDKQVDALEIAIDDACIHVIARRQPAAIDLRLVMSISKAVKDIERIGDEAKKIAKSVRKIVERGPGNMPDVEITLRHMGDLVIPMVHDVLDAFVRSDAVAATRVVRQDKEVDLQFRAATRQLVTFMMEDPRTISTALDLIFIAKSLERVGDHAKNIAESVIFIAPGRDVRHQGEAALGGETEPT